MQRLAPLAQRLHTDFTTDARFDNPRAVQIRLPGFDHRVAVEVGRRVRDLYADGADAPERIRDVVDDDYVATLAEAVAGELGDKVGIAPRVFLKKLVGDVLDRVDQFDDFDPRALPAHASPTPSSPRSNATPGAATSVDDIDLDIE